MPTKRCDHCGKEYSGSPSKLNSSRFCSASCSKASMGAERKTLKCERCGADFVAKQDHGRWPRFCCRKCFLAAVKTKDPSDPRQPVQLDPIECRACGGVFMPDRIDRIYCSNKCRFEGLRKGHDRACVNCGQTFHVTPSVAKIKPSQCCSAKCRFEYYKEGRSRDWEGGHYQSEFAGHSFTYLVRPGYVGKYIQDHRLLASQALGRPVERGEVVVFINRDKTDIRPENLFLCGSMSEYAKRRSGSLPWPTKSNLMTEPYRIGASTVANQERGTSIREA